MKIDIIKPCGFCKGVKDAIDKALSLNDNKIYCLNPIVHNEYVTNMLESKGIITLKGNISDLLDKIDSGTVIFSAHGTNKELLDKAYNKGLKVVNTICKFVAYSHDTIKKYLDNGYDIIFIGKANHPETKAVLSISNSIHLIENKEDINNLNIKNNKIALTNQTTLSILDLVKIHDKIKQKYNNIVIIDEICNATRIRQEKVKEISSIYDVIIVVGDVISNNTKSLFNIAKNINPNTIMVNNFESINLDIFNDKKSVAIISGTSTPDIIINDIYNKLSNSL